MDNISPSRQSELSDSFNHSSHLFSDPFLNSPDIQNSLSVPQATRANFEVNFDMDHYNSMDHLTSTPNSNNLTFFSDPHLDSAITSSLNDIPESIFSGLGITSKSATPNPDFHQDSHDFFSSNLGWKSADHIQTTSNSFFSSNISHTSNQNFNSLNYSSSMTNISSLSESTSFSSGITRSISAADFSSTTFSTNHDNLFHMSSIEDHLMPNSSSRFNRTLPTTSNSFHSNASSSLIRPVSTPATSTNSFMIQQNLSGFNMDGDSPFNSSHLNNPNLIGNNFFPNQHISSNIIPNSSIHNSRMHNSHNDLRNYGHLQYNLPNSQFNFGGSINFPISDIDRSLSADPAYSRPNNRSNIPPRSTTPGQSNFQNNTFNSYDDRSIDSLIVTNCSQILQDAAEHALKAVELANTLRARVGTEVLSVVRERFGGLLSLLEKHNDQFLVERIPKSDRVSLKAANSHRSDPSNDINHDSQFVSETDSPEKNMSESNDQQEKSSSNNFEYPQTSRCLHVGNVPANYTEAQLAKEFEKFGQLEGIKLVSHKNCNRRFAFVTFRNVVHAVNARHCLSKVQPWKSAISFAHKELVKSNSNSISNPNIVSSLMNNSGRTTPNMTYANNNTQSPNLNWKASHPIGGSCSNLVHLEKIHQSNVPIRPTTPSYSSVTGVPTSSNPPPGFGMSFFSRSMSASNLNSGEYSKENLILLRLCDDTYVPTQPWPVDHESDLIYCKAVIDQISQFGGRTTISKLRGFLKHRIGISDNIKSVPLKAMLIAYPNLFKIENNFVSLAGNVSNLSSSTSSNNIQALNQSLSALNISGTHNSSNSSDFITTDNAFDGNPFVI